MLKIRLEIRFNNVLDIKEPFLAIKTKIFEIPKSCIFPKGLTHAFGQKCQFFLYLVLVKTRLQISFNNVLDRKETFSEYKNKIFQSPQNHIFPKGVSHAFGQKMPNFSLCGFGQNKSRKNVK